MLCYKMIFLNVKYKLDYDKKYVTQTQYSIERKALKFYKIMSFADFCKRLRTKYINMFQELNFI